MAAREHEMRRRIALEAARLIGEHGIRDFALAKRKAAERLHMRTDAILPKNHEIEEALREHQRLFQAETQPQRLRRLRESACAAMRYFDEFQPRLVGAVLDGTADAHSTVSLHLFSDTPEQVLVFLDERSIDYAEDSRRLRIRREAQAEFPLLRVTRDGIAFDLTLFPLDAIRQAPLDRGGERPMRRARLGQVETLLTPD